MGSPAGGGELAGAERRFEGASPPFSLRSELPMAAGDLPHQGMVSGWKVLGRRAAGRFFR